MQGRHRGFTLIEQLVALSVAGTVSATALPALVDFHARAEATALASLAAAAGSAMLLNQAGCLVSGGQPLAGKCEAIADCQQVAGLLMAGLPPGYSVRSQPLAPAGGASGGETCRLQREADGASAGFYGVGTTR